MSNLLPPAPPSTPAVRPTQTGSQTDRQDNGQDNGQNVELVAEPVRLLPTRPVAKSVNVTLNGLPSSAPFSNAPTNLPSTGLTVIPTREIPTREIPTREIPTREIPVTPVAAVSFNPGAKVEVNSGTTPSSADLPKNVLIAIKPKKKRKTPKLRLTERDRKLIEFLTRYKLATYGQAATHLQMDQSNLRHRIVKLDEADLIKIHSGFTRFNLLGASAAGIRALNMTLPVFTPSLGTLSHTLALTDLGIFFENEGQTVVTEREIRAAWQHGEKSVRIDLAAEWQSAPVTFGHSDPNHGLFVVPPPLGKTTGLRIPDMVLVSELGPNGSPRSIAVEMELTTKEAWRYKEIVSSYMTRGRNQFAGVIYYTPYRDVSTAVGKAIREGGASSFMAVREYTPTTAVLWH
jgi:hypothetical protein